MENPWHSPFQHRGFKCLRVTTKAGDFLSLVALPRHEFEPCIGKAGGGRESLTLRLKQSKAG